MSEMKSIVERCAEDKKIVLELISASEKMGVQGPTEENLEQVARLSTGLLRRMARMRLWLGEQYVET